jgi:hypothetical protein
MGRRYGSVTPDKTGFITARHGRFGGPVSKTTFVGTLISDMSFETLTP